MVMAGRRGLVFLLCSLAVVLLASEGEWVYACVEDSAFMSSRCVERGRSSVIGCCDCPPVDTEFFGIFSSSRIVQVLYVYIQTPKHRSLSMS